MAVGAKGNGVIGAVLAALRQPNYMMHLEIRLAVFIGKRRRLIAILTNTFSTRSCLFYNFLASDISARSCASFSSPADDPVKAVIFRSLLARR